MDPVVLSYLPLVSPVATLVVVVLGVFFSNRHVDVRISDLRAYIDVRIGSIDARIGAEARVNEANFKMLLGKIEDVDTRLTRLEERFSH
jgi:hypothetical protein